MEKVYFNSKRVDPFNRQVPAVNKYNNIVGLKADKTYYTKGPKNQANAKNKRPNLHRPKKEWIAKGTRPIPWLYNRAMATSSSSTIQQQITPTNPIHHVISHATPKQKQMRKPMMKPRISETISGDFLYSQSGLKFLPPLFHALTLSTLPLLVVIHCHFHGMLMSNLIYRWCRSLLCSRFQSGQSKC